MAKAKKGLTIGEDGIGRCWWAGPDRDYLRYHDDDALQHRLRDDLLREGEFHISSTEFLGKRYLRLVLMHPDTDESIIGALLDRIDELAGR